MNTRINQTADETTLRVSSEETVCIPLSEYADLIRKAERLDLLAEEIARRIKAGADSYVIVDDSLVMLMTGTKDLYLHGLELQKKEREAKAANEAVSEAARQVAAANNSPEEDDGK